LCILDLKFIPGCTKRLFEKPSNLALTPNPSVLSFFYITGEPQNKNDAPKLGSGSRTPLSPDVKSETRQRGAGTAGDGGVRARGLCLYMGE
jgi:hypothetical protein